MTKAIPKPYIHIFTRRPHSLPFPTPVTTKPKSQKEENI
jgi:hypothetical protein